MGGWFSNFMSKKEENNNALLPASKTRSNNASTSNPMATRNTMTTRNTRNSNSKIFEKIINISYIRISYNFSTFAF